MPIFQPRNRVQIIRDMVARVVGRSELDGLEPNGAVYHVLAAAASEDAEQYFQLARLRKLFSLDKATGSDLDARAKEIVPGIVSRIAALSASGDVTFSRQTTVGSVTVPAGTIVAAEDASGLIKFRTTTGVNILAGNLTSAPVAVVAIDRGVRGNVAAATIVRFVSRVAGVTGVTNASAFANGRDRESDDDFKARIKAFVQAMSRGTKTALESFAKNVILVDGRRVLFAKVKETAFATGVVRLYIDDGTGSIEEYDSSYIGAWDTFVVSAAGGETNVYTTEKPIRDDGGFALEIDSGSGFVAQVRGTDYELNPALGQVELSDTSWPTGLPAAAVVRAEYRFYTGLIKETQRVVDGDESDPLRFPGVRAAGVQVLVVPPQAVPQTLIGTIAVLDGYDIDNTQTQVATVIQGYINSLNIGDDVIVSEIIERAMGVSGMHNFRILSLSGGTPEDQVILDNQVARIASASITLT